jgi:hypothetical protein
MIASDTLEIIFKWLQVSVSECNRQTPQLKSDLWSRDLVPSDRATCTIASRVNSLPYLSFDFEV